MQVGVVPGGAVQASHKPAPMQPQLETVPAHWLPLVQTGTTGTLQMLLPAAQPYAVCVWLGCCTSQEYGEPKLQYFVQVADTHAPLHQTWPLLEAFWVWMDAVGHVLFAPSQAL